MTDSTISYSYVKSTTVSDIQQVGTKLGYVVHFMAVCKAERSEAEALVTEVKSQLEKAIKLNDFASRMERQLNTVTGDSPLDNQKRFNIITSLQQEADVLGVDTSSWKGNSGTIEKEKSQSIVRTIENAANNCMSNVRNAISKAVESLGRFDGIMSSAIEALKEW